MFIEYGKLALRVIDLTRFERETVWTEDGADLLSIRTTLGAVVTYAPGGVPLLPSIAEISDNTYRMINPEGVIDTTASDLAGTPRGLGPGVRAAIRTPPVLDDPDTEQPGRFSGPETDAELRAFLWAPRKRLRLWAYSRRFGTPILWLQSPRPGFDVDLDKGPRPLSVDVVSASGEPNSVAIHWQVQTEMSPCPVGSDRLVLSHRWQMSHGHDENFYLTRTIEGTIIFNRAVVQSSGVRPDFVRAQFIHPIPVGFRRNVPQITQSPDGNTIRYVITDTDPTITFDPGASGATQMQIVERLQNSVKWGNK